MATYTLTTSQQEVGKNLSTDVGARLLAWYSDAGSTSATVHLKLQAMAQSGTYTGTNKDYELTLGSTATGTVTWSDSPLPQGTWVDVKEITQTVSFGSTVGVSGKIWTYVHGDCWILGNSVVLQSVAPVTPTVSSMPGTATSNKITYGTTSFGTVGSGTVYLYGGTSAHPSTVIASKTTVGDSTYAHTPLVANTGYFYRANAYNGSQYSSYSTEITQATLPEAPAASVSACTSDTATIAYSLSADGGFYTKDLQYNLGNGSPWVTAKTEASGAATSGAFQITGLFPKNTYSVATRISTTAGTVDGPTLTVTTTSGDAKFGLYGSSSGGSKEIVGLYGSVNGVSKRVTKLYGSVNGVTKRIY